MTTQLYRSGETAVTVHTPDIDMVKTPVRVGGEQRMLDGTMKQRIIAHKWRWECTWSHLTDSEYSTLIAELRRSTAMRWSPPDDASTYDVIVTEAKGLSDRFDKHSVSATIEEI